MLFQTEDMPNKNDKTVVGIKHIRIIQNENEIRKNNNNNNNKTIQQIPINASNMFTYNTI